MLLTSTRGQPLAAGVAPRSDGDGKSPRTLGGDWTPPRLPHRAQLPSPTNVTAENLRELLNGRLMSG